MSWEGGGYDPGDIEPDDDGLATEREFHPEEKGKHWAVDVMPQGDWGARAGNSVTDGFSTKQDALLWCCFKLDQALNYYANKRRI